MEKTKETEEKQQLSWATEELRKHFSFDPAYKVIGGLAVGGGGNVVVEVHQTFSNGYTRPLVIKRVIKDERNKARTNERENRLKSEIEVLKLLQGAEHIVQRVALNPDPLQHSIVHIGLTPLPGPYLVMEKAQLGSLHDFIERTKAAPYPLPNRVLWRFFLGLLRACTGMAWPPRKPDHSFTEREVPGPGEMEPMINLDISPSNIMLDLPNQNYPEHYIAPKVKLIDFGRVRLHGDIDPIYKEHTGAEDNVYRIGKVMLALIFKDPGIQIEQSVGVYMAGEPATVGWPACGAPLDAIPDVDDELRILTLGCLAQRPSQRLALRPLLEQAEWHVEHRDAAYYRSRGARYHAHEADGFARALMNWVWDRPEVEAPEALLDYGAEAAAAAVAAAAV